MLKKFYVVVDEPCFKDEIKLELTSETGNDVIPERPVEVVDPIPSSEHSTVCMLTQEEADALISDLRIRDVHIDPEELGVKKAVFGSRSGNFDKSFSINSGMRNWGLIRSIYQTNIFGSASTTSTPYTFNLDGTGVDIVILDTGVDPNHPEFAVNPDGTGGSRVVDHDWSQYGFVTTPTGGFLGDCDGHGSNVASILAGNTNGWAPGARIYSLRTVGDGSGGPYYDITDGRQLDLLNEFDCWRSIKAFHAAKPIDPKTGYKRPTVVNASFGYIVEYSRVTSIRYRGSNFTVSTTTAAYGTIGIPEGGSGLHGFRFSALDTEVKSVVDSGIVVIGAAGNDFHKIDVVGGLDYNNFWTEYTGFSYFYHRGATPGSSPGVICVGAIGTTLPEHKINFSCTGPRVDTYAPGVSIMGAYDNKTYVTPAVADPRNVNYFLNKLSGTSQACPQVAGIVSLLLQLRPNMTATNVLSWLNATGTRNVLNETFYGGSGYTNFSSLQSGTNILTYMPFNSAIPLSIGR